MEIKKLIVSHHRNLLAKYGPKLSAIEDAVERWRRADALKGLRSQLVYLDQVASVNLRDLAVGPGAGEKEFKDVIDALFTSINPDYLTILGAPDVVPHQTLVNPAGNDGDPQFASDMPYACTEPAGNDPCRFRGPSRVVGRLPDLNGGSDASYLVGLIDNAAAAEPRTFSTPSAFVVSSESFLEQTQTSMKRTFGTTTPIVDVPRSLPPWEDDQLLRPFHFFNCHGGRNDPSWMGQNGSAKVAQSTSLLLDRDVSGAVVAAECCYSAELYPLAGGREMPICNAYLARGAWGLWGSTTLCYGTVKNCEASDLLCSLFIFNVLQGKSLGRAALEARQAFISTAFVCNASIKAAAQFLLLGDPSITPVLAPDLGTATALSSDTKVLPPLQAAQFERTLRRRQLAQIGDHLSTVAAVGLNQVATPPEMSLILEGVAQKNGVNPPLNVTTMDMESSIDGTKRIHVVFTQNELADSGQPRRMLEIGQSDTGTDLAWVRLFVPR